jgi:molybdenum cofactor cytidylyltransferase
MRFGPVPVEAALGGVVAHQVQADGLLLKKGAHVTASDIDALRAAGIASITVALLDPGDVAEDEAAAQLASAIAGPGVRVDAAFTGRANLFAEGPGLLVVDREAIDALNRVDEAVTFATLAAFKPVVAGEMIATVKIIPYAVPGAVQDEALSIARTGFPLVRVAPFARRRVGIISTRLPGLADKVIAKTLRVTADRLAPWGASIAAHAECPHETGALTEALARLLADDIELVVIFGASAIADRRDVIPAAIEAAGGRIAHFGMPVDPGNLMLVGAAMGRPVIGAPGCARSPKENGFDWVLARLVAGLEVTRADITGMGVGGLLMEIVSRPQPRLPQAPGREGLAGVILAAGRSTRMGGPNKLLLPVDGQPMVRHAAEQAIAAGLAPVLVVTGHQAEEVRAALAGLPVLFVHNPDFAQGLSTSVRAGISAVPPEAAGAMVVLGDMPRVGADVIGALIAAFSPDMGACAVVPVVGGKRGNPVLWSRGFFPALATLEGDAGARHVIGAHPDRVIEVPVEAEGVLLDVDTPDALAELRGKSAG